MAPKKQRKGHGFLFRVDLAWPDSQKVPKYIVSCRDGKDRDAWVRAFTTHPAAGKANSGTAKSGQKQPAQWDAKELAEMEFRKQEDVAGLPVTVPPSSAVKCGCFELDALLILPPNNKTVAVGY